MKFRFLSIYLFLTLAIFVGISPSKALATSAESISVNTAPDNPTPNQKVTITLTSYLSDLDSVLIIWSVNGKTALSGIGKKSFSLNAPATGGETRVTALISFPDGNVEKTLVLRPSVMDLFWQADDSYVPPFYKGKALPTAGSEIKVVAIPQINVGAGFENPNNMTYDWKQDYDNAQTGSGYGRNSFLYTNDYLEDTSTISVTASTVDQQYSSTGEITIGTSNPEILFYRKDPALGTLWEQALGNGHKVQEAEILQAAPYFISPKILLTPVLTWDWYINDTAISLSDFRKYLLPLQVQAGVSGTSKIRLNVGSTDKIFETASQEINVKF